MSTAYAVLVRSLVTRTRVLALGLVGVVGILLALAARGTTIADRANVTYGVVDNYGLAVLVPLVTLVFASAALGDLAEDGTLVYLWLRPLPRWRLAVAAWAAALSVAVPVAVVPMVVAAAVTGQGGRLVMATAAGTLLAAGSYSAVFCGLGLRVRRALAWGLAYLLIWEQAVARLAKGAARVSMFATSRSVMAHLARHSPLPHNATSTLVGVIVPCAFAVVALVVTTLSLNAGEVT